jgi:hypothetical protein
MKLAEIATIKPFISEEATEWLWKKRQNHSISDPFIQRDGTIDVDGNVIIFKDDGTELPVQFGKVSKGFECSGTSLTTLKGVAHFVGKSFRCNNLPITSFEGAPMIINGNFSCYDVSVAALKGIGKKYARHIGGKFVSNREFTHMLGLVLVEGLQLVNTCNPPVDTILNKYLGTGDIISAQDELIDAGFREQARL